MNFWAPKQSEVEKRILQVIRNIGFLDHVIGSYNKPWPQITLLKNFYFLLFVILKYSIIMIFLIREGSYIIKKYTSNHLFIVSLK